MKRGVYRDPDYAFGQIMLTLRSAIGFTQASLAASLGVSRQSVVEWEAGSKYPKVNHLQAFIALAVQHGAFSTGLEADEIRSLWKASHQKVLLDETWLNALLTSTTRGANWTALQGTKTDHQKKVSQYAHNNLPFEPTAFVGRAAELQAIAQILDNPACRLLTLLGPGGAGKTRLALVITADQAARFSDGAAFVALASISAPNQIISAIGDALQLSFDGQRDPIQHVLDYLQDRHMLLILDNFEHVIAGVDLIVDIIERAPRVSLLVTSRELLHLQAEWIFDVQGLSYPTETEALQNLNDLTNYEAVKLFVQRVRQIQPNFPLLKSTLTPIARICAYVSGIPLAIELAAAHIRTTPIGDIERQLRGSLDTLSTPLRDVPARHRSLRAVIDHSWNLLSEAERALLSRLSVFRGGCGATAALEVAGATQPMLMALVAKSLLREIGSEAGSNGDSAATLKKTRYSLLEPIREYALEKLTARGEAEAYRHAHASHFLAYAEAVMANWDASGVGEAVDQFHQELNNVRAALKWSCDSRDSTTGLQLAGVLWRFWRSSGYTTEGRGWLEELLALDHLLEGNKPAMRARLLGIHAAAWLASDQHDYLRATQLFEQSVPLRRALGETEADTHLLHNAALQARAVGQYEEATAMLEQALSRNRALSSGGLGHSLYELGFSLYGLALLRREQGDFDRAIELFKESLLFHLDVGDRESYAQALLGLGDAARDKGEATVARDYTEQSLTIYREFGTQWAIGFGLNNLAQADYLDRDFDRALNYASESVDVFRSIQNSGGLAEALVTTGSILIAQGDMTAAKDVLYEALQLAWEVGPRLLVVAALEGLAVLLSQTGETAVTVQLLAATASARETMGTPIRPADQLALEQTAEAARRTIGEAVFAGLWEESAAQPLEQIVRSLPGMSFPSVETPDVEAVVEPVPVQDPVLSGVRHDWDDAFSIPTFYGRQWELSTLKGWLIDERCQVVTLLGFGGSGKSALAIHLMHQTAEHFELVIWRSLRDVPDCDYLLDSLLQIIAPEALGEKHATLERRQSLVLDYFRNHRVLLVLDSLDAVLEEGISSGRMRSEFEGVGRFLRLCAERKHQSCLLLTSREKSIDLMAHEGNRSPVRVLRLAPLGVDACKELLAEKDLRGSEDEQLRLIEAYAGNPLALKIIARTIVDLFNGEIAPFLDQGEVIFGSIRTLLEEQFSLLSSLEQNILMWLTVFREPTTLETLMAALVVPVNRTQLLEAMQALYHRSLIERGQQQGSFTLQALVMEYLTSQLITDFSAEIERGELNQLAEYGLHLTQFPEYIRQTQERRIIAPILAALRKAYPQPDTLEEHLLALLASLASRPTNAQGYAASNLVTLLYLHRGHLRDLDLSKLVLRGITLQGIDRDGSR